MPLDLSRTGVDPADPAFQPLLNDLQGNILKSHGRNWMAFLFIKFQGAGSAAIARRWIGDFARRYVTSALDQERQAEAYRASGRTASGGLFANFLLSAQGYLTLGFPDRQLPRDLQAAFNGGMKVRQGLLRDPTADHWQREFQQSIDALVLLASDDENELAHESAALKAVIDGTAGAAWIENGSRWFNQDGLDIEPFGYVDSISQPLFFKDAIDKARAVGTDRWDPSAPLDLVLFQDPNGVGADSYGSFLVYRKLEQNVPAFDRAITGLAQTLGTTPELAGAYAVGRFKDGTPVVLRDRPSGTNPPENNFDHSGDPAGRRCPFHAHTRKTNPRGDTNLLLTPGVPLREERGHRIVRRSVNYGQPNGGGHAPVGMHFLCFQADLGLQFEFIQASWANTVGFLNPSTGTDPITGQGNNLPEGQEWPRRWGDDGTDAGSIRASLTNFVTLQGGEYFFAPSVGFLKNIDAGA